MYVTEFPKWRATNQTMNTIFIHVIQLFQTKNVLL